MRQGGRPSAASLSVVQLSNAARRSLDAPAHLKPDERSLFQQVVNENDPAHFAPSDAILLASYVQATMLARSAARALARRPDPKAVQMWERCVKMQAILATKLRLAPQSRLGQRTAARLAARTTNVPAPWETIDDG